MTERTETAPRLAWLTSLATLFTRVTPGRWLALMLLALHAAVVLDAEAAVTRAFLLAHYGLFLLWQPLVRSEARIEPRLALPVFAMAALLVLVDSTWVMALWLAILAGLVGAVATSQNERGPRLAYLLALAYLLSLLLAWVLPQSLGGAALARWAAGRGALRPAAAAAGDPVPARHPPARRLVHARLHLRPDAVAAHHGGGAGRVCRGGGGQGELCLGAGADPAGDGGAAAGPVVAVESACRVCRAGAGDLALSAVGGAAVRRLGAAAGDAGRTRARPGILRARCAGRPARTDLDTRRPLAGRARRGERSASPPNTPSAMPFMA